MLLHALVSTALALPLPLPFVPLNSSAGLRLLADPSTVLSSYEQTAIHHLTQADEGSCFRASATIVLNALATHNVAAPVDKRYHPYAYWTQENVVSSDCATSNCSRSFCWGTTLERASRVLRCVEGVSATVIHARSTQLPDALALSALLNRTLATSAQHLILNFVGTPMGIAHGGHYSPCVAYHAGKDMALVLDVSRYKFPPWWVPVTTLWRGLDTIDSGAGKRRGVIRVGARSSSRQPRVADAYQ